jgi:hypothetical protein
VLEFGRFALKMLGQRPTVDEPQPLLCPCGFTAVMSGALAKSLYFLPTAHTSPYDKGTRKSPKMIVKS